MVDEGAAGLIEGSRSGSAADNKIAEAFVGSTAEVIVAVCSTFRADFHQVAGVVRDVAAGLIEDAGAALTTDEEVTGGRDHAATADIEITSAAVLTDEHPAIFVEGAA